MRKLLLRVMVAFGLAVGAGSVAHVGTAAWAQTAAQALPVDPVPLVAQTALGKKEFSIEVADDTTERSAGLMFRQTMDDTHGMLFVFPQTQPVAFWMKNTPMPLDLIFIDQGGLVRDIEQGKPFSEDVITPGQPVRFVLELKAGTAEREGIANGVVLHHPAIERASLAGGDKPNEPGNGGATPSDH